MKNPFLTLRGHVAEVVDELKRCNWPTTMELRDLTIVVIISVIIMGVAVAVVDFASTWAIRHMTQL